MLYPTEDCLRLRQNTEFIEDAIRASLAGSIVNGIKGKTVLNDFIDIPEAVPIDSLHFMNEGIFKCLLSLWLDSKNKDKDFYIGLKLSLRSISH